MDIAEKLLEDISYCDFRTSTGVEKARTLIRRALLKAHLHRGNIQMQYSLCEYGDCEDPCAECGEAEPIMYATLLEPSDTQVTYFCPACVVAQLQKENRLLRNDLDAELWKEARKQRQEAKQKIKNQVLNLQPNALVQGQIWSGGRKP